MIRAQESSRPAPERCKNCSHDVAQGEILRKDFKNVSRNSVEGGVFDTFKSMQLEGDLIKAS
jgi:hypothetical protein